MEVTQERQGYEGSLFELLTTVRDTLRRRWKLMAAITAAIFLLGVGLVMMMTPKYQAVARIQIDPTRDPLAKSSTQQQSETLSPEAIETEVSIINSRDLAEKVIQKLRLQNDPELTKGFDKDPTLRPGTPAYQAALVDALQKQVSAGRDKLTYIINVGVRSTDPVKAATIANTYASLYLANKIDSQAGSARSQVDWFRTRLDTLRDEVRDADAKVAQYRASAGIVTSQDGSTTVGTMADEQVGPLSSQIATAESQAASAQARLAAAQQQASRGGLDSVSEVRSSLVVGELRRQRADLLRQIGEIQARYGDKHPESVRVKGQLETIDRQIKEEGERVLGSLRADAAAANAQVGSLHNSMQSLEARRAQGLRATVEADSLDREAASKRAEYNRLSQMMLESTQAAQTSIAQAQIVGRASPPQFPASPNKPLLFALSLLVGLVAGAGTITVQEMMSAGVKSGEEIEELFGFPMLAAIPRVPKGKSPAGMLIEEPTSIFSEAFRVARASVLGIKNAGSLQTLAVSSALPSEGKTTSALSIARTFAIGGEATLIIECDVRRASLGTTMELHHGRGPGIVEYLHGEAPLDQIIEQNKGVASLDQILVRAPYFSSEDLFSGPQMKQLLDQVRGRYQRIILDLPPLIGLADGRILASMADGTILAIQWDETPQKAIAHAVQSLKMDGTKIIGGLLTMVDTRAEAIGGLYYSKKYSNYYQKA